MIYAGVCAVRCGIDAKTKNGLPPRAWKLWNLSNKVCIASWLLGPGKRLTGPQWAKWIHSGKPALVFTNFFEEWFSWCNKNNGKKYKHLWCHHCHATMGLLWYGQFTASSGFILVGTGSFLTFLQFYFTVIFHSLIAWTIHTKCHVMCRCDFMQSNLGEYIHITDSYYLHIFQKIITIRTFYCNSLKKKTLFTDLWLYW